MRMQRMMGWAAGVLIVVSGLAGMCRAEDAGAIVVQDGQKVAFLGDSITANGWSSPTGYVHLVIAGLASNGVKATAIPAGISGHKSDDMLARVDRDVISKKPDWMTISCGVNDVWHGAKGVPLDKYKENMTAIVDKAQAAGIKVMILTSTVIGEDVGNANNVKLKDYNAFLKELATQKKCLLADLNTDMQNALDAGEKAGKKRGAMLTGDGVHPNAPGNMMMATGILKTFGLSDSQVAKAKDGWLDIPNGVALKQAITLRQYRVLEAQATKEKCSVDELVSKMLTKDIEALPKPEAAK